MLTLAKPCAANCGAVVPYTRGRRLADNWYCQTDTCQAAARRDRAANRRHYRLHPADPVVLRDRRLARYDATRARRRTNSGRENTREAVVARREQVAGLDRLGITQLEIGLRLKLTERTVQRHLKALRQAALDGAGKAVGNE